MEMIKKKQKQNNAYRTRSARRTGPKTIVLEFVEEVEELRQQTDDVTTFDEGLTRIAGLFESRIIAIDPDANITIHWNNESNIKEWQELRVEAVTIEWSRFYLSKHQFKDKVMFIDVGALFLEGFLD